MLGSAINALNDRMDARFLTAYWVPAFVFFLGCLGIVAGVAGPHQLDAWISDLDAVEQTLGVVIVILLVSTVAFVLRALTRPMAEVFAGIALPRFVAAWSTRGQQRAKARAARRSASKAGSEAGKAAEREAPWVGANFPVDDADMRPTLFGNVLASAGEHPRFAYAMEGALWWPRLSPLVPSAFAETLANAQAPMVALFNLSLAFAALAPVAVGGLGVIGSRWAAAAMTAVVAIVLSRLSYRAAVSQSAEVATILRVGFDLYRGDILDQLGIARPADLTAERELWVRLTREVLALPESASRSGDGQDRPVPEVQANGPQTA